MALKGKNKSIYSFKNKDRSNKNFKYKDFEKTKSYASSFEESIFDFTSFRGAHMKFCNFNNASFIGSEFIGTNLRGSRFKNAVFKNAIFKSANLDRTNFKGSVFRDCYFINTSITGANGIAEKHPGITFLNEISSINNFSLELIETVESLRANDLIKRSGTLHLKKGKINTLTLSILLKTYSEEELICLLPKIPNEITTEFYTLSYLKNLLKNKKAEINIIKKVYDFLYPVITPNNRFYSN